MKIFHITWDITERCNKQCRHCYNGGDNDAGNLSELNLSELEHALAKVDSALSQWGKFGFLAFTGGEALLRRDDLLALMGRAETLPNIGRYQLLTNGSLMTAEVVEQLKGFRKLAAIQLSLESSSPEVNNAIRGEGSFEETLEAIRLLKKHGFRVLISTTITRSNYLGIPALIKWVDKHGGVDEVGFDRLIPSGRGKNLLPLYKDELRQVYDAVYSLAPRTRKVKLVMRRPLFCLSAPEDKEIGAMCSAGINNLPRKCRSSRRFDGFQRDLVTESPQPPA